MEQASTFDIASSLSSLHQLREENLGLEDSVDRLIARRDNLVAAHARLLALNSLAESRRDQQTQRVPSSATDQRLVSPVYSRPLVSPSPLQREGPSPWVNLLPGEMARAYRAPQPSLPSPRDRRELPSPRDRDHCPPTAPLWPWSPSGEWWPGGLGPAHMPPDYRDRRQQTERMSNAQLMTVVQAQAAHHQASSSHPHSATLAKAPHPHPPPKAHYPHPRK